MDCFSFFTKKIPESPEVGQKGKKGSGEVLLITTVNYVIGPHYVGRGGGRLIGLTLTK